MRKEDSECPKYHKTHATNFKFKSKNVFKFHVADKTQRKRLKVNLYKKILQGMTKNHKEYSDFSYEKIELLFKVNKTLFFSFRVIIIIIIITDTVFNICFC